MLVPVDDVLRATAGGVQHCRSPPLLVGTLLSACLVVETEEHASGTSRGVCSPPLVLVPAGVLRDTTGGVQRCRSPPPFAGPLPTFARFVEGEGQVASMLSKLCPVGWLCVLRLVTGEMGHISE